MGMERIKVTFGKPLFSGEALLSEFYSTLSLFLNLPEESIWKTVKVA